MPKKSRTSKKAPASAPSPDDGWKPAGKIQINPDDGIAVQLNSLLEPCHVQGVRFNLDTGQVQVAIDGDGYGSVQIALERIYARIQEHGFVERRKPDGMPYARKFTLPLGDIRAALSTLAHANRQSPRLDYYEGLPAWDGKERLRFFWAAYGDTDDPDGYVGMAYEMWAIQKVARAYEPGCQADSMFVLSGPGGEGKTRAMHGLVPEDLRPAHFGFNLNKFEFAQAVNGMSAVIADEMTGITGSNGSALKEVITRTEDPIEEKYEPARRVKRGFVIMANTNEYRANPDLDPTQLRRFWNMHFWRRHFPVERLQAQLDGGLRAQLDAEAVAKYKRGDKWWLADGHPDHERWEKRRDSRRNSAQPHIEGILSQYIRDKYPSDDEQNEREVEGLPRRKEPNLVRFTWRAMEADVFTVVTGDQGSRTLDHSAMRNRKPWVEMLTDKFQMVERQISVKDGDGKPVLVNGKPQRKRMWCSTEETWDALSAYDENGKASHSDDWYDWKSFPWIGGMDGDYPSAPEPVKPRPDVPQAPHRYEGKRWQKARPQLPAPDPVEPHPDNPRPERNAADPDFAFYLDARAKGDVMPNKRLRVSQLAHGLRKAGDTAKQVAAIRRIDTAQAPDAYTQAKSRLPVIYPCNRAERPRWVEDRSLASTGLIFLEWDAPEGITLEALKQALAAKQACTLAWVSAGGNGVHSLWRDDDALAIDSKTAFNRHMKRRMAWAADNLPAGIDQSPKDGTRQVYLSHDPDRQYRPFAECETLPPLPPEPKAPTSQAEHRRTVKGGDITARMDALWDKCDVSEGNRNNGAFAFACACLTFYDYQDVDWEPYLRDRAASAGLPETEIASLLKSARKTAQRETQAEYEARKAEWKRSQIG